MVVGARGHGRTIGPEVRRQVAGREFHGHGLAADRALGSHNWRIRLSDRIERKVGDALNWSHPARNRPAPPAPEAADQPPTGEIRIFRHGHPLRARFRRSWRRLWGWSSLRLDCVAARDHRSDFIDRAGEDHHRDMNQEEAEQQPHGDEVDRAGRLTAAEQVDQAKAARDRRPATCRGRSGPSRKQNQEHRSVGQLLEDVVSARRLPSRESQPRVILDVLPQMARPQFLAASARPHF